MCRKSTLRESKTMNIAVSKQLFETMTTSF